VNVCNSPLMRSLDTWLTRGLDKSEKIEEESDSKSRFLQQQHGSVTKITYKLSWKIMAVGSHVERS
jgi:hypothetical protein